MFSIFMKEKIATIGMLTCFFVSILLRLLLATLYQRMIRETDNMATTNNKLLKQCKLKFSNCYQLNNGMSNVQVFVEKFLSRLAIGPFSFRVLYHLSGQLMLLSVVFSGVGVCRSIIAGSMFGEILPFYICSLLELYLYFSITTLLDIKGKRKALKINLIDYLENHLSYRMQVTREDLQMLYGAEAEEIALGVENRGGVRRGAAAGYPKGVEVMPIAGWLASRDTTVTEKISGDVTWEGTEKSHVQSPSNITEEERKRAGQAPVEFTFPPLDPEESAELELLLKEILSLS